MLFLLKNMFYDLTLRTGKSLFYLGEGSKGRSPLVELLGRGGKIVKRLYMILHDCKNSFEAHFTR